MHALFSHSRSLRLVQAGILLTFLLAPFWLKWPGAPAPFSHTYVLGFVLSAALLATIAAWMAAGFPGWKRFVRSRWRVLWLLALLLLAGWAAISVGWAYGVERYPGLAPNTALQILLVTLFALVTACVAPSPRIVGGVLIASMLLHGTAGGVQVALQGEVGLAWLGEFLLNPQESGVSVVQSGNVRWLRPYGFLPHPNVLAGVIVLGLLAAAGWVAQGGKRSGWGVLAFLAGLWLLLLTFSRAAWLGFAVGVALALPFVMHVPGFWRRFVPLAAASVGLGIAFLLLYQPFLLSRVGIGQENTEMRSLADRVVYMRIAEDAIQQYPLQGVGAGNYPWYAAVYLFYNTEYDLRGDNVHHIYAGLWAELGIVGLSLFLLAFVSGVGAVLQQRSVERIALLAGVVAFAVIGFFDHYPWTLPHTQMLWMGLLAVGMSPGTVRGEGSTPSPHNS